jgi:MOSC domain-containing protein YiiM
MGMQLISVNIGRKRTQQKEHELETTGIYKTAASGPVEIGSLGIPEDFVCDAKNHGGPDQAVYLYGSVDYAWWAEELGRELAPGTFGDNLTIDGFESARFNIGDRLHIGSVILEVTAPRLPCSTLAARMGDPKFVKRYRHAARPGLYCRVIREGTVQAGDEVKVEPCQGETVAAIELFTDYYRPVKDERTLRRFLAAPIAIRARRDVEADLQKLLAASPPGKQS